MSLSYACLIVYSYFLLPLIEDPLTAHQPTCILNAQLHLYSTFPCRVVSSQVENVNMAASTLERTQVFLCYSHDDIDLTDPKDTYGKELSQLMTIYRNQRLAEIWSDRRIDPGAEYLKIRSC